MRMLKKLAYFWCAMALACAGAVAAQADLIVDTGPDLGGTYTGGNALYKYQWMAGQFSLSQACTITQVQGLIGYSSHGGDIEAIIRADVTGLPGGELQHQTFTTSNSGFNTWQGPSGLSWILPSGTYWLAFEVNASSTFDGAMTSSALIPLQHYAVANTNRPPNNTYSEPTYHDYFEPSSNVGLGIRVYGDPSAVPLPSTLLLLGSGLVGLVGWRRFRKG